MSGLVGGVYSVCRDAFLKTFPLDLESPPLSRTLRVRGEYMVRRNQWSRYNAMRCIDFLSVDDSIRKEVMRYGK